MIEHRQRLRIARRGVGGQKGAPVSGKDQRLARGEFDRAPDWLVGWTGVRIDSGDLAALACEVRKIFDEAGLKDVKIIGSGGLDVAVVHLALGKRARLQQLRFLARELDSGGMRASCRNAANESCCSWCVVNPASDNSFTAQRFPRIRVSSTS